MDSHASPAIFLLIKDVGLLAEVRFLIAGDINGLAKNINEFVVKLLSVEEKRTQLNEINEEYNRNKIAKKMKAYE